MDNMRHMFISEAYTPIFTSEASDYITDNESPCDYSYTIYSDIIPESDDEK